MNKQDWTKELPQLMEDYTEPVPEGLWEAIRSEVGARRKTPVGWGYAAGALAAAAAVALVVVLNPFRAPSALQTVPEETLAEERVQAESETPAESAGQEPSAGSQTGSSAPVLLAETRPAPKETIPVSEPETPEAQPVPESPSHPEDLPQPSPQEQPVQPESPSQPEPASEPASLPQTTLPQAPENRRPSRTSAGTNPVRVQLGVTASGLLAQANAQTLPGGGKLAYAPSTRSMSGGNGLSDLTLTSQNRPGSSEARYRQSARFGVGVLVHFLPQWGIESGLVGTRLNSSFEVRSGQMTLATEREYTYWGIPLNLHYDVLTRRPFNLYLTAGPMAEYCRSYGESQTFYFNGKTVSSQNTTTGIRDWRWSLNAGAGVQWNFFEHNALFVQPGFSCHFPSDGAPDNFYSAHPAAFQLTLGYRLILF